MSASLRLKRFGTKKRPFYRIVVMDSHAARNGKVIEELGWYHPIDPEDKQVLYDKDKVHAWIEKGAIVSPTVKGLLKRA